MRLKKRTNKLSAVLLILILCIGMLGITAYAEEDDETGDPAEVVITPSVESEPSTSTSVSEAGTGGTETDNTESVTETVLEEAPEETEEEIPEESESESDNVADAADPENPEDILNSLALTPEGNLTLVDDISYYDSETGSEKQFITVVTKSGNYFYLIIDRDNDGNGNVYFLNMVDERDLLSLMDEEEIEEYNTEIAEAAAAAAAEAEAEITDVGGTSDTANESVTEAEDSSSSQSSYATIVVIVVVVICGVALFLFLRKPKGKNSGQNQPDPDSDYETYDDPDESEPLDPFDDDEDDDYNDDEPV